MALTQESVKNAAGRQIPAEINGRKTLPWQGVGMLRPEGQKAAPAVRSCADFPADGDKRVDVDGDIVGEDELDFNTNENVYSICGELWWNEHCNHC